MYKFIIIFSLILFSAIRRCSCENVQIINGNKTTRENYPWIVSINTASKIHWIIWYTCSGTLISKKWVITSAHCYENRWYPVYQFIRAGSDLPESDGVWSFIDTWTIHPDYDSETAKNDVALILLSSELEESNKICSIEMINQGYVIEDGLEVRTAAFGKTCDECKISQQLFELVQTTCTPVEREKSEFDDGTGGTVMCSIDKQEKSTICNGDSGAGFTFTHFHKNILLGVISHTTPKNCNPAFPVFSASISIHREWIKNKTGI
ncbi:chymotrypsin-like protease CTRL-1 [Contarinia nasturtii]|uniref:chymotrypsin-like protease CTRL-1 n=1 Tax=Contarinia nasturtii TaxID=265458 RepID=UPI0012D43780|nr:chymotrypsin-like protease CTRL-1 [Contarinia nasturtii]